MNKKFLSAILFGALMVTSTGTFVSCKDYDDDIDAINKELTDVKSQIAALQAKVDAGKWITSVSSNAAGVTINLSDGSSLNITNGKDGQNGAQGEAGKDGKDGSVVEVKDGVLYINGEATEIKVAEEAPAALPCVKVENGELMILGENNEYVASGIKACSVVAVKENGVWTITTADGESIVVPGSAALTSIAIQGDKDLVYNYGWFKKDVEWGWKKEMVAEAGFYSRLKEDVQVLLNPAEADGTAFTYAFRNSAKIIDNLTFFGEARPSTAVLTRAASGNGVWTLPAEVTKHAGATSISELRNELYLNFKQNDKEYYPVIEGAVIDYKIRVTPTLANKRKAEAFGIELTADEKGFIANNESAVYNEVQFQVAYVTINGTPVNDLTFKASFKDEFTSSEEIRVAEMNKPFDAAPVYDGNDFLGYYVMSHVYDLNELYKNASEEVQMVLDNQFKAEKELIGGESAGDENYNELNRNELLARNINWTYDEEKKELTAYFYVSSAWTNGKEAYEDATEDDEDAMPWEEYSNFQLKTAYQLNLTVVDGGMELAKIELPFELDTPTLDITQVPGEYTQWGNYIEKYDSDNNATQGNALYAYAAIKDMGTTNGGKQGFLPLYDSFTTWMEEGSHSFVTGQYDEKVENAEHYELTFTAPSYTEIFGYDTDDKEVTMDLANSRFDYSSKFYKQNTWSWLNGWKDKRDTPLKNAKGKVVYDQQELAAKVKVSYKQYGVYERYPRNSKDQGAGDFYLVFASWLNHSTLEMVEDSYETLDNTNAVLITNDDLNFKTPKGDNFYLFDGLKANGKFQARVNLNSTFDEDEGYPFTTAEDLAENDANGIAKHITAKASEGGNDEFTVWGKQITDAEAVNDKLYTLNKKTGEREWDLEKFDAADDNEVRVFFVNPQPRKDSDIAAEEEQALEGGMIILLPKSVENGESVTLTFTLTDSMGYTKTFEIEVEQTINSF